MARHTNDGAAEILMGRHLRFGWWSLLIFLALGMVLEALHAFKVGWYLNVTSQLRRDLWTLAHAHGTLIAVINLIFGLTVRHGSGFERRPGNAASWSLIGAGILMPAGFLLGGVMSYGTDPGLGILFVPIGSVLLFAAVLSAALSVARRDGFPKIPGKRK